LHVATLLLHFGIVESFVANSADCILSWLPTYYHHVFDQETGSLWFTSIPYLAMAVAANFGGWGADRMISRGVSLTRARMIMTTIALSGASLFLVLFSVQRSMPTSVALMAVSLAFMSLVTGGFEANYLDIASPKLVGSLKGLSNTLGALSGVLAMPYTLLVLRLTGDSWRAVFASLALFFCLGMGVFGLYGTSERVLIEHGESCDEAVTVARGHPI
jgi:MFS transporter, ACS family, solute carrier family 17 (sodium-dependent inorganic phosphate cotransporter), other